LRLDLAEAIQCKSSLGVLEVLAEQAIRRVPPFHGGGTREIVRQPKVYAFDTGLVAHERGWESLRGDDCGHLWENLVLDELCATFPRRAIHHWRTKSQREIDFVVERGSGKIDAIEAKLSPDAFDVKSLAAFRALYPEGRNYVACPVVAKTYSIKKGGFSITVCPPDAIGQGRSSSTACRTATPILARKTRSA
jgi:hypothetical protein